MKKLLAPAIAGFCAGSITGLFGAGGGLVLIPLLTILTRLQDHTLFSTSLCVMLPICLVSVLFTAAAEGIAWNESLPYLISGTAGGLLAGLWGERLPVKWLHRGLGLLILWGGIRYLC